MEDNKLNLKNDGIIFIDKPIEKALQQVYEHFRMEKNRNDYLQKENDELRDEAYKDKELAEMKEKYENFKQDYYRGFPISEKEEKKIGEWMDKMIEKSPSPRTAIGGRFKYEFLPTSIGTIGTVVDTLTNEIFEFRELS